MSAYFSDPLDKKVYHVLVLVPQQKYLFELDSTYLHGSGLPSTKLVLFCLKSFHDQFKFLHERVLCESRFGWILGPPGTGKSTTNLAFISLMPTYFPEWTVTWIHLCQKFRPACIRFANRQKWSMVIDMGDLNEFLVNVEGKHVFLDGFVPSEDAHIVVHARSSGWRISDTTNRRLVVVCSGSSRGETNMDDDKVHSVEEFFVDSWNLEEYRTAAQHIK
ncbi:hypothetical protein BJ741DRAFT_318924 [Chytriomyces cf. hyalinus JEL632]|nr:hypothetical protein BJ741DRAFT_318924 [Chytriomyces cf. hyalinus JEL632]